IEQPRRGSENTLFGRCHRRPRQKKAALSRPVGRRRRLPKLGSGQVYQRRRATIQNSGYRRNSPRRTRLAQVRYAIGALCGGPHLKVSANAASRSRGAASWQGPFGFRLGGDGELVPDEAEQEAIREMVALRAQGKPLRAIADAVRRKG